MALVPVTAAVGGPFTSINCPDDHNPHAALDIRRAVSCLLRNDALNSAAAALCVLKAGDTMTGKLIIAQATTNATSLEATGNGSGAGALINGGSTGNGAIIAAGGGNNAGTVSTGAGSGMGISATGGSTGNGATLLAGGGNAHGVAATGAGTGSGIACTGGSTGPGITATPGTPQTNTAPTCAARVTGYIQLTGTDPTGATDPGANNVIHGCVIPKASVTFDNTYSILERYNVASITQVLGDIYALAFVRPMANANYGVKVFVHGSLGYSGTHNNTKSTTGFQFLLFKTDTLATGFGTATEAYIEITGRQ